jgi:general stress protein CsbA
MPALYCKGKKMNYRTLVKLSNIIGIASIIALVYWVFIFITIMVFGLKVFKENITETFFLSILGILALMAGALMLNIMSNLTRIAEQREQMAETMPMQGGKKIRWIIFAASFPLILALLFAGDYLTIRKKEQMMLAGVESIVKDYPEYMNRLLDYEFSESWLREAKSILNLYRKTNQAELDKIIVADSIGNKRVFLSFENYYKIIDENKKMRSKPDFIWSGTNEEKAYLNDIFDGKSQQPRFSARDGRYEIFYPYSSGGKTVVLYFREIQRYGKIGS